MNEAVMNEVVMDEQGRKSQGTALITGASGGIGLELARILARRGYGLVLVARDRARLKALADELQTRYGVTVRVLVKDLSRPQAAQRIWDALQNEDVAIDVLVNNAGFGSFGPFIEDDLDAQLEMIAVNVATLTHLTKLFLPPMREKGRGKILNVASTAAFQPGPLMAVYYATKAYVLSFSRALTEELAGSGVTVTTLCPGPTQSGFQERAQMQRSRLAGGNMMDARTVALAGYRGLVRGQAVVIPGARNKLFALLSKLLPGDMVVRIVRRAQEYMSEK